MLRTVKLLLSGVLFTAFATATYAAIPGEYINFQAGYSKAKGTSPATTNLGVTYEETKNKDGGYILALGYNFGRIIGFQIGGEKFTSVKYENTVLSSDEVTFEYWDANANLMVYLPFGKHVDLYAGGGYAYVRAIERTNITGINNDQEGFYRPRAVLGLDYNIDDHWAFTATYVHIFGKGSLQQAVDAQDGKEYLPDLELFALGFNYYF